jgi:ABC-type nickel/cobalt efflux system permease component RcnA
VSAVAVLLIALGVADLCRRVVRAAWPPLAVGPVVVVVCAALCALWHVGERSRRTGSRAADCWARWNAC